MARPSLVIRTMKLPGSLVQAIPDADMRKSNDQANTDPAPLLRSRPQDDMHAIEVDLQVSRLQSASPDFMRLGW